MTTDDNNSACKPEHFFNVDAVTNAIDYLESAAHFLERNDDFKWKWVAIAVFHALYGFSIVALERSNPDWVLSSRGRNDDDGAFCKSGNSTRWNKSRREFLEGSKVAYRIKWDQLGEEPIQVNVPDDPFAWTKKKLIGFWTALARIQDPFWMGRYIHSQHVTISDNDFKAIEWLGRKVRNELLHFIPKHWGISIEGIQCGCLAAVKAIESLVFDSNTIYPLDEDDRSRIRHAIASLQARLPIQEV